MEKWINLKKAAEITGKHHMTIRKWCKKGLIECKRIDEGKGASPYFINELSIPTFLRKNDKSSS